MLAEQDQPLVFAVKLDVAFQVQVHHAADHLGRDLLPVEAGEDPGVADGGAPDHDRLAAGMDFHALDIRHRLHVPVADDRNFYRRLDLGDGGQVEPVLARCCCFGLNFLPEILVRHPFSLSNLLFGDVKNALKLRRVS